MRSWFLWLLLPSLLGCRTAPAPPYMPPALPPWPSPIPYTPPRATATPSPIPLPPTPSVPPTPTPLIYTIRQGDTLSLLAARFGIPVRVILTANPNLNPKALPVGATVVIPLNPTYIPALATPTLPASLHLEAPSCYPAASGAWCFLAITNQGDQDLLFLQGRLWLPRPGPTPTPVPTWVPLNLPVLRLPAGERLPMVAYVPSWPGHVQVQAQVHQALPLEVAQIQARFPQVVMEAQQTYVAPNRLWVRIQGVWHLETEASWVRLLGWLEDGDGRILAVRALTWKGPWKADELPLKQPFTLYLYPLARGQNLQAHLWLEAVHLP